MRFKPYKHILEWFLVRDYLQHIQTSTCYGVACCSVMCYSVTCCSVTCISVTCYSVTCISVTRDMCSALCLLCVPVSAQPAPPTLPGLHL